jgi:hypothetical protein
MWHLNFSININNGQIKPAYEQQTSNKNNINDNIENSKHLNDSSNQIINIYNNNTKYNNKKNDTNDKTKLIDDYD